MGFLFPESIPLPPCLFFSGHSELFNILVSPVRSEFALCWHRDDIKGSASEDEELAALTVRHYGV